MSRRGGSRLTARLVLRKAAQFTFEITADGSFDWAVNDVTVVWGDGTALPAQIVERYTTGRQTLRRGEAARLTIRLEKEIPDGAPRHLLIVGATGTLRVPVLRA